MIGLSLLDLVERLAEVNVRLRLEAGELRARAPKGALGPELVAAIATHRPSLLALLAPRATYPCTACGRFAFPAPATCYWCRRAESRHPEAATLDRSMIPAPAADLHDHRTPAART